MKQCVYCGFMNDNKAGFCGNCGGPLPKKKSKTGLIITLILVAVVIGAGALTCILLLNNAPFVDEDDSVIQANITNWGLAFEDNDTVYYSDFEAIYVVEDEQKEVFFSGCFSDLIILGDKLYCTEYPEDEADFEMRFVSIDTKTKEKQTVFEVKHEGESIYVVGFVGNKIYFASGDHANLYSVDKTGKVKDCNLTYADKVTSKGVYTNVDSQYGLKLVSLNGKTIKEYDAFDEDEVYVQFELGSKLCISVLGEENNDYVIYDTKDKSIREIKVPASYGTIACVNTDGESIYVTCLQGYDVTVCELELDERQVEVVSKYNTAEEEGGQTPLLSAIVDDYMYTVPIFGFGELHKTKID